MNKALIVILATVLFDLIWLWIVIPILPFIIKWYWFSEFYIWLTLSIFALWMFFGWLIFWKLSDKIWRNKTLKLTIILNIIWYLLFAISSNLYIFMIARFIWWLWASWFAVWQAYVSDISNKKNKAKNMSLVSAMFWLWLLIGPMFWWFLSKFWENLNIIWFAAASVAVINLLFVFFLLPEIEKNKPENQEDKKLIKNNKNLIKNPSIIILFIVSFIVSIWFSAMQSTFPLVMMDRFWLDAEWIWYLFWIIWITAVIYQLKFIKYLRNILKEIYMLIFWLIMLILWFLLFSINNIYWFTYLIIILFPIWNGSINPIIASMHSKLWGENVWKNLWINASMLSLWNIFWPILAGSLYMIWSWVPYVFSSILFFITLIFIFWNIKKYK